MDEERVSAPISIIWFKEGNADMNSLKYVFDTCNYDMLELWGCAKSSCEVDVFLEHDCSEHLLAENEVDLGYKPDEDERMEKEANGTDADERMEKDSDNGADVDDKMEEDNDNESDDGNRPPKNDDEPEDSEDERPEAELNEKPDSEEDNGGIDNQNGTEDTQNHGDEWTANENKVDDGDDVVVDAGNGGDDNRFQSVFEEATKRNEDLEVATQKLAQEQAAKEKEEEDELTDPEFGLEDVKYPDKPLSSDEEWEQ